MLSFLIFNALCVIIQEGIRKEFFVYRSGAMAMMTLKDIPDELHSALKARAKRNNRSLVAEVRNILKEVLQPEDRVLMGDALVDIGQGIGLTDEEVGILERNQDKAPAEPVKFE